MTDSWIYIQKMSLPSIHLKKQNKNPKALSQKIYATPVFIVLFIISKMWNQCMRSISRWNDKEDGGCIYAYVCSNTGLPWWLRGQKHLSWNAGGLGFDPCIGILEYYLAHKKRMNILPFSPTWIDLESIMLGERSQTEKEKYYMISLRCGI